MQRVRYVNQYICRLCVDPEPSEGGQGEELADTYYTRGRLEISGVHGTLPTL